MIASLSAQLDSQKQQNRCLQRQLAVTAQQEPGVNVQAGDRGMDLSQLIQSDRLLHEENEKAVAELKQAVEVRDAQNRQLTA